MSSDPAIVVDGVSKRYRLYQRAVEQPQGGRHPSQRRRYEEFWALKDVSLEVERGTVYGLVGHNGSGKSTLLRMMAGIQQPEKGKVRIKGRVSALLELGAGFHPELTGRENVFLNAAILGLPPQGDRAMFDDIVDFSGLGEFIDTPVKVLLERHVRAARVLGGGARAPRDPDHRRGHRGRRRGVPAPLLRVPLQDPQRGRDHRDGHPRPRHRAEHVRPRRLDGPRRAAGRGAGPRRRVRVRRRPSTRPRRPGSTARCRGSGRRRPRGARSTTRPACARSASSGSSS